jgi:hypothetical protein
MRHPQLGFPRLRVGAGRATDIAIGPDHTLPKITTARETLRFSALRVTIPSKVWAGASAAAYDATRAATSPIRPVTPRRATCGDESLSSTASTLCSRCSATTLRLLLFG